MDDDKINKTLATIRFREANREGELDPDEIAALDHLIRLYGDEAAAKKAAKYEALFSRIDRAAMPPDESIEMLIEIARGMAASS